MKAKLKFIAIESQSNTNLEKIKYNEELEIANAKLELLISVGKNEILQILQHIKSDNQS